MQFYEKPMRLILSSLQTTNHKFDTGFNFAWAFSPQQRNVDMPQMDSLAPPSQGNEKSNIREVRNWTVKLACARVFSSRTKSHQQNIFRLFMQLSEVSYNILKFLFFSP